MKYVYIISLFFISMTSLSQNFSKANAEVEKLEFNSRQSEVACDVVEDNLFYFKNKKSFRRNSIYHDLFMLDVNELNEIEGEKRRISLTKKISESTDFHEGPCFIDKKNNRIYITISSLSRFELKKQIKRTGNRVNTLKIIEGDYKDGKISNLKDFTFNNLSYSVAHATYSNVTQRLYFATTDTNGFGKSDLYYCHKKEDGTWEEPHSLGNKINSENNEVFPTVKGGVLFFSSDTSKEDLDLYYILESDIGVAYPKLLPEEINSDMDDFLLCFDDNKNQISGYFTSNRDNIFFQNDDIYSFKIEGLQFKRMYKMFVEIKQRNNILEKGKVSVILNDSISVKTIDLSQNKEIVFDNLIIGENYSLKYESDSIEEKIVLEKNIDKEVVRKTMEIEGFIKKVIKEKPKTLVVNTVYGITDKLSDKEKKKAGILNQELSAQLKKETKTKVIEFKTKKTFDNVYFAYGSHKLYKYSREKMDKLLLYLENNEVKYILIEAFTDSRSSSEFNEKLAIRRALFCRKYLVDRGVPENKIIYKGFGENRLTNDCGDGVDCPESEHKKNRRVEFTIVF